MTGKQSQTIDLKSSQDKWQSRLRLHLYQFLQICEALGPVNSYYAGKALGHPPSNEEKAWHYYQNACVNFQKRFGFILDLNISTEEVVKKLEQKGIDEVLIWHMLSQHKPV